MPLTNALYYNTNNNCGRGRMQDKGTCWFHAILNVFLLSTEGRKILREALQEYMANHTLLNIRNNSNSCPMRGTINKQYFWSYVKYKLTNLNSGRASRNNLVSENYLIRNMNLRSKNKDVEGGNITDVEKFIEILFPTKRINIVKFTKYGYKSPRIDAPRNAIYLTNGSKEAFGAWIAMNWYHKVNGSFINHPRAINILNNGSVMLTVHGHGIAGFICKNGERYIYDSNNLRSIKLDWTKPQLVADYLNRNYGMNDSWEYTRLQYAVLYR